MAFHFRCDRHHFIQRRCDEAREADNVGVMLSCRIQNGLRGHHHPEVNHFEVIALQYHADNVFADVVHIALDGGHDDNAVFAAGIA